jgi:hypothetical protein
VSVSDSAEQLLPRMLLKELVNRKPSLHFHACKACCRFTACMIAPAPLETEAQQGLHSSGRASTATGSAQQQELGMGMVHIRCY